MTFRALFLAVAVLGLALPRVRAESTFVCGDPHKGMSDVVCADRELTALGKAVDARFNTLVTQADALTRLLLRRDQGWFAEILGGADTPRFAGQDDPERLRLKAVLAQRLATLDAIMPRAVAATPAGIWANALATLTVSPAGEADTLQVKVAAKLACQDGGAGRDEVFTIDPDARLRLASARSAPRHWSELNQIVGIVSVVRHGCTSPRTVEHASQVSNTMP